MNDRKRHLAELVRRRGQIGRRRFLRDCAALGLAAGGLFSGLSRRPFRFFPEALAAGEAEQSAEVTRWLKDAGAPFRGKNITIKYATEATPPSQVLSTLVARDFTAHTGIRVEVEIVPLEQVLQKLTQDVAGGLGSYDLYYLDQSWMASFSNDTADPRELYESKPALAMPGYDFGDFLAPLTEGISMFRDKMVGVPFDIPIFIVMYRRDIYDKLGLAAPRTFADYLANAEAINREMAPEVFGTTGQMKSGHYSLNCDWTNWLWGHGGSIFGPDNKFSGNDEAGVAAMEYWTKLKRYMPPDALNWTWDGEFSSVAQGIAAQVYSWGEFFPGLDNPESSKVSGLMEAASPLAARVRSPAEAGFGEIPGTAHQGGSALAVSKYSKNLDAAWLFAQWGSSADMNIRVSLLGGGASPMRRSTYEDARIRAKAKPGAGTTRHFDVTRDAIENYMGSEPDHPAWAQVSNGGVIPTELGRFFAGEYDSPKAVMDEIAAEVDRTFRRYG
jgi:multiple sugar transport system substrate-binding protein